MVPWKFQAEFLATSILLSTYSTERKENCKLS